METPSYNSPPEDIGVESKIVGSKLGRPGKNYDVLEVLHKCGRLGKRGLSLELTRDEEDPVDLHGDISLAEIDSPN